MKKRRKPTPQELRHQERAVLPRVLALRFIPEYREEWQGLQVKVRHLLEMEDAIGAIEIEEAFRARWQIPSIVSPTDPDDLGREVASHPERRPGIGQTHPSLYPTAAIRPLDTIAKHFLRIQVDGPVSMRTCFKMGDTDGTPMFDRFIGSDPRTKEVYARFAAGMEPDSLTSVVAVIDLSQSDQEIARAVSDLRRARGVRPSKRPARVRDDGIDVAFGMLDAVEHRMPRPTWKMLAKEFLPDEVGGVQEDSLERKIRRYLKEARTWVARVRADVGLPLHPKVTVRPRGKSASLRSPVLAQQG